MTEALHLGALIAASVGTCCALLSRSSEGRAGRLLMWAAMMDTVLWGLASPVVWAAALILAAVSGSIRDRSRRGRVRDGSPASVTHAATHRGVASVVMAALLISAHGEVVASTAAHQHGTDGNTSPNASCLILSAAAFAAVSAWMARRGPVADRLQYSAMGISTALMAIPML